MNWESANLIEAWKKFEQVCNLIFSGPLKEKSDAEKCSYLLLWIGETGRDIFNSWTDLKTEDETKIEKLCKRFKDHVQPKTNVLLARKKFYERTQEENETFDRFATAVRNMGKECGFKPEVLDEMLRDRIVFGNNKPRLTEKFLREGSALTLPKAIELGQSMEFSINFTKKQDEIHAIHQNPTRFVAGGRPNGNFGNGNRGPCSYCGKTHQPKRCPAFGKRCDFCGIENHVSSMCRKRGANQRSERTGKVYEVREPENRNEMAAAWDQPADEVLYLDSLDEDTAANREWRVSLPVNNSKVNFKLDTGASCNVLPLKVLKRVDYKPRLTRSQTKLVSYSGHPLKTLGKTTLLLERHERYIPVEFHVIDDEVTPLLGLRTCVELSLVRRLDTVGEDQGEHSTEGILDSYDDVFDGLGKVKGHQYKINIDFTIPPVVHPPRRVPHALRDKLKNELDRMEGMGVIEKVNYATDWVNSIVVVDKPDKQSVRVCLDPKDLNKAIRREYHPMRTIEEVAAKLSDASFFSVLDASHAFWNLELDPASTDFTCFNTPFGRYKYLRLPMGLSSSPEVWQRTMEHVFEGIEGVAVIMDDLLIWGKDKQQHTNHLKKALERAREFNIKLNRKKAKVEVTEVKYIGHILTTSGIKPCPERIQAINDMQRPTDKKSLQRFMGMVAYVSKFVPQLSAISHPLRELLENSVAWHWEEPQEESFKNLKKALGSAPTLQYFNTSLPILLSVDSSSYGLGACLMQNGLPVAYASRSLSKSEKNYAQIEKEMTAICFGCSRFHDYIYGAQNVTVETDHKPIESLFKKSLALVPARIQRMMLKMQKYDIDIIYKPGKELYIADTLSRDAIVPDESAGEDGAIAAIDVQAVLPVSSRAFTQLRNATEHDEQLQQLLQLVKHGWPEKRSDVPHLLLEFWNIRDEITAEQGILLKGTRLIIPKGLRNLMLSKIHAGHFGVEKCRRRARDAMYWPGMNADIQTLVSRCEICAQFAPAQPSEPLRSHSIPDYPWQKLGMDLFELSGKIYLVITDYYSKFFEIEPLQSLTSAAVVNRLKPHFARYGLPEVIISDGGPQFNCQDFRTFCANSGVHHVMSSPKYPQSNGMAEATVKIAKKLMQKCTRDGSDYYLALLAYRTTPISGSIPAPAQLLMGRRIRSDVPMLSSLFQPKCPDSQVIKREFGTIQDKQKCYYDRKATPLNPLSAGDPVRVRDNKVWIPAVVVKHADEPYSYWVRLAGTGNVWRRNRRDLRFDFSAPEVFPSPSTGEPQQPTTQACDTAPPQIPANTQANASLGTRPKRVIKKPAYLNDFVT